jgi:hypothetical protein
MWPMQGQVEVGKARLIGYAIGIAAAVVVLLGRLVVR